MMVAGEASGDVLGGDLICALKQFLPGCNVWGIGGDQMAAAGAVLHYHVNDLGVTGFTEVVRKLPAIIKIHNRITALARDNRPDAVILIDYPDFNLRLARRLKKAGLTICYYVSPQLWAWRASRVRIIRNDVDCMMVLFPFEVDWYKKHGVKTEFVGHPVVDRVRAVPDREACRRMLGIDQREFLIAMLPGSRMNEVSRTMPVMLKAHDALLERTGGEIPSGRQLRFLMPLAATMPESRLPVNIKTRNFPVETVEGHTLEVLRAADCAWVTSGTASLETALLHTPQLVVYKTSPLSFRLARRLVSINYISIANLVMDAPVATELIQDDCTADNLIQETLPWLEDPEQLELNRTRLLALDRRFGEKGASHRAASVFLDVLKRVSHSEGKTR